MKSLITTILLLTATVALADIPRPRPPKPMPKPESAKFTQITEGTYKVKALFPKCATNPVNPCRAMPSSALVLTLPLVGCLDTAQVSYSIYENQHNSDVKVIVSALNVSNPKSSGVKCVKAPEAVKSLVIGGPRMLSKNVSVEFLQNLVTE